ncbi:hypothetical protein BSKO_01024 [Bryopsis sp. KO-2023]|nr:hypothetical protein BSKO_01024 [Bryopsis sp. KO-2023]
MDRRRSWEGAQEDERDLANVVQYFAKGTARNRRRRIEYCTSSRGSPSVSVISNSYAPREIRQNLYFPHASHPKTTSNGICSPQASESSRKELQLYHGRAFRCWDFCGLGVARDIRPYGTPTGFDLDFAVDDHMSPEKL